MYPQDHDSQAVSITDEIETLFTHKFYCYLRGQGHPQHPAVTAQLRFDSEPEGYRFHDDKVLRSRLFLRFATGSELMPAGVWNVKVNT